MGLALQNKTEDALWALDCGCVYYPRKAFEKSHQNKMSAEWEWFIPMLW